MGACCDLEVDINGEETFMLNKNILSSFSRKFSNLFGNLVDTKNVSLKVIFNDFPGGAHAFELIVRLCYSNSRISMELLSPSNMALLCSASNFLEMNHDSVETPILKPHTEKFLEGIRFWTWCELLEGLKQFQLGLFSSNIHAVIVDRIVDQLIEKISLPSVTSPYTCSSNRSSFQFSCDSSSYHSWINNNSFGATWWFEDLLFLKVDLIDKVIRRMISHDFDHGLVSKFLFYYYYKSAFVCSATQAEKIEATNAVINLLSLINMRSISCKDLFNLNRIASSLKMSRDKIENLIGPLLDQATIDYLLLPSPHGMNHAYDVDFVQRLIHIFFFGSCNFELNSNQHKRVVKMMDLFLVEVAPDPNLKPSEFEALIAVLPDNARESHDQLYIAMDMFLKVHAALSEKEKISICSALNYEKLSSEYLRNLSRNLVFPSEAKPRANVTRQSRMKSLLQENDHLKNFFDSMFRRSFKNNDVKEHHQEINEVGDFKEMQCVKKSDIHIMSNAMYLPKLCS